MNTWQAPTNQQVFYTQTLLSIYSDQKAVAPDAQPRLQALLNGAGLAFSEAFRCWLNELNTYYKVSDQPVVRDYHTWLASSDTSIPQIQRLINLEKEPDSWLGVMLRGIEKPARFKVSGARPERSDSLPGNMIAVSGNDAEVWFWDADTMAWALKEFKAYLESVRAEQTEW